MKVKFLVPSMEGKSTDASGDDPPAIKKAKKFLSELSKFKVDNNCQKFAAALELKYRGVNKEITPTVSPLARVFDVPMGSASPRAMWQLIKNCKMVEVKGDKITDTITDTMKKWGNGSRAIISTEWKSGRGHVFNLLNVDGEVWLLDATANRAKPITKSDYLKEKTKSAILYRSDDGSVDKEMVAATFGEEGRVRFTLAQGNKRIRSPSTGSVLAYLRLMCHSKGDIFEVYQYKEDNKKAKDGYEQIGRIRSTGIDATYGEGAYEIVVWNYEWI